MDIREATFLKTLDENRNKTYYARITVLDMDENPIQTIEGKVLPGSSISIVGSSSVRRTCNISIIADKEANDLTDIDNLLSVNKKIKIYAGLDKDLNFVEDVCYVDDTLPSQGSIGKVYVKRSDLSYYYWNGTEFISMNTIFDYQKSIIWFPMGVYVIAQPTLTNEARNYIISLSCKDKMALLNGELGGNFPTSVTFHEYDQVIGTVNVSYSASAVPKTIDELIPEPNEYNVYIYNYSFGKVAWEKRYTWTKKYGWKEDKDATGGDVVSIQNPIYDIILTCVANYGNELLSKIIINDVPKEIKQIVHYTGSTPLYFNSATSMYTMDENDIDNSGNWKAFSYNDDVGYVYTPFIYPGALVSNIGDNVCSVLDKIINTLGNYEYFYDIDGNFIFQEIRNYLNNSYNPLKEAYSAKPYYIDNNKSEGSSMRSNNLKVIGRENYKIDIYGDQKSVYTFQEGNNLIVSYNNSPSFTNLKNDFHIWGKNPDNNYVIHYHVAIKEEPPKTYRDNTSYAPRDIVYIRDSQSKKFTGRIRMLDANDYAVETQSVSAGTNSLTFYNKQVDNNDIFGVSNGTLTIDKTLDSDYTSGIMAESIGNYAHDEGYKAKLGVLLGLDLYSFTPEDPRAELYIQGLEAIQQGKRPDIYQQELLDLFDSIYEWGYYDGDTWIPEGRFKSESIYKPNSLNYWFDLLQPVDYFYGISVDDIEPKLYSYQQDKIVKIYTDEVPDCILIDQDMCTDYKESIRDECLISGQPWSNVNTDIYGKLVDNTIGYSAQEVARSLLYQYTTYNETITLQCLPIYYLDVNSRITVEDRKSGIHGDYIINSINLPLSPTSTMTITAAKALDRI